ncbi:hypothetical protein KDK_60970 [Dictyobacter kobayashii]|uniref:3-keto-disaccharide hydrolase domain-containing protein n=1 Tax=Dictyobacter kobayashii TaxID=2014872 RepID=A0A402AT76_9CHLR|nr:hypothetical protein KDK_60970 [Dictyobacter kobayashii]
MLKIILPVLALLLVAGSVLTFALTRNTQAPNKITVPDMHKLYVSATMGVPRIDDPLNVEGPLAWLLNSSDDCSFKAGVFHVANKGAAACNTVYTELNNFAYQAEMTILQGTNGGLIFRNEFFPTMNDGLYYFNVTTQGAFSLSVRSISHSGKQLSSSGLNTLLKGQSAAIKKGLNQTNLLTVIALGSTIYLYINKQFVGSIKDSTTLTGTIGMFSQGENSSQTLDVTFKNLQVWIL